MSEPVTDGHSRRTVDSGFSASAGGGPGFHMWSSDGEMFVRSTVDPAEMVVVSASVVSALPFGHYLSLSTSERPQILLLICNVKQMPCSTAPRRRRSIPSSSRCIDVSVGGFSSVGALGLSFPRRVDMYVQHEGESELRLVD